MTTPWTRLPPLSGDLVRLEELTSEHAADLAAAVEEHRGAYGFTLVPRADEVAGYIAAQHERIAQGLVPIAQIRCDDGRTVGCTGLWNPRYRPGAGPGEPFAVEIGFTWLAASALGRGINAEAKLLLMAHAFDVLGVERVDFKTDARNERSRQALHALGATFEGVLRRWNVSWAPGEKGGLRDSAMFSVVAGEWEQVRAHLTDRVRRTGRTP